MEQFIRKHSRWVLFGSLLAGLLVFCLSACSSELVSPDGRYRAELVNNDQGKHYRVVDTQEHRTVLITHAEFDTENDVKKGLFSEDSTKFAAAYHYSHQGSYTWIGIWSTESGELISTSSLRGWVTKLDDDIFQ